MASCVVVAWRRRGVVVSLIMVGAVAWFVVRLVSRSVVASFIVGGVVGRGVVVSSS
ncbi:hypothetical protein ACXZ9C_11665 [Streptococcus agalactiae]